MFSTWCGGPRRQLLSALQRIKESRHGLSSKVIPYKQDLPPAGGYAQFDWERIPQSKFPSANKQFAALILLTLTGYQAYKWAMNNFRTMKLEILDAKVALQPLLLAERDRLYLRRIRRNFEAESELMKDVPGWEVGKWYDQPIYKTLPPGHWVDPQSFEYWEHCDEFEYQKWYHWWWTT